MVIARHDPYSLPFVAVMSTCHLCLRTLGINGNHVMVLQGMLDRKEFLDPWDREQALSCDIMGVLDIANPS